MSERDFYEIVHEGVTLKLPRVTSILRVIDKSGPLMGWAVREERLAFQAALQEVLTSPNAPMDAQAVWDRMQDALKGARAYVRKNQEAKEIGGAAHQMIHWHLQRQLGLDAGPEPSGPDGAIRAAIAFLEWAQSVELEPLWTERLVYCPQCAFAGTTDLVAKIDRRITVVDFKTGRAIYDEAHAQVRYYEHGLKRDGVAVERAILLRLPKTADDPGFEVQEAAVIPHGYLVSIRRAWEWQRKMQREETGSVAMQRCDVA